MSSPFWFLSQWNSQQTKGVVTEMLFIPSVFVPVN